MQRGEGNRCLRVIVWRSQQRPKLWLQPHGACRTGKRTHVSLYVLLPAGTLLQAYIPELITSTNTTTLQELRERYLGKDIEVAVIEVDMRSQKLVASVSRGLSNCIMRKFHVSDASPLLCFADETVFLGPRGA